MMDLDRLEELIALGEGTDREFKSDRRQLSDRMIYEEVVALAARPPITPAAMPTESA